MKLDAYNLGLKVGRERVIEQIIEILGLDERYEFKDHGCRSGGE